MMEEEVAKDPSAIPTLTEDTQIDISSSTKNVWTPLFSFIVTRMESAPIHREHVVSQT